MSSTPSRVLIITSAQPSLNPRVIKEADALAVAGFQVIVIYQYLNKWGTALDNKLLKSKKWKAIRVGGDPIEKRLQYNLNRIIFRLSKAVFHRLNLKFAAIGAITRSSYQLIREAKKIKADFYIGHNLGALPATVIAAKFHKKKCGFDAEDFHRYERSDDPNNRDVILKKYLEEQFFSRLSYLTTASNLISEQYTKLYPDLNIKTIVNVFPKAAISFINNLSPESPLKLFWFSQTVGNNRGLEDIVKAMGVLVNSAIELHLLGSISSNIKKELLAIAKSVNVNHDKIFFYDPIDSDAIIPFAAQFHIGLATEIGVPFNREICLTNKIFTYIQAGLVLLASDTSAQKQFLNAYSDIGSIYQKGNVKQIASIIELYNKNHNILRKQRRASFELGANELNWENESKKLIKIVEAQL